MEEKTKKIDLKKWGWVALIIFIFFIIVGSIGGDKEKEVIEINPVIQEEKKVEVVEISAVQLGEEYNENEIAADSKYKGKTLKISGIVDSIGKDILGTPYIVLEGGQYGLFGVQCMFNRGREEELIGVQKGQRVILKGKGPSFLILNVIVRDCEIIQ